MSGSKAYLLPDQVYGDEEMMHFSISDNESEISMIDNYAQEMNKLLKSLEIWDDVDLLDNSAEVIIDNWPDKCHRFLADNNIRPEFFCQYEKIFSVASSKNSRRRKRQPLQLLKGRTTLVEFFARP